MGWPRGSVDQSVVTGKPLPLFRPLSPRPFWSRLGSSVVLLGAWSLVSWMLSPRVLPGPLATLETLWGDIQGVEIFYHLGMTLFRICWSFALAMLLGVGLGLAMGLSRRIETWCDTWLVLALNTPALIYIFLAYLALGLNEFAAVLAVAANKVPV